MKIDSFVTWLALNTEYLIEDALWYSESAKSFCIDKFTFLITEYEIALVSAYDIGFNILLANGYISNSKTYADECMGKIALGLQCLVKKWREETQ